MRIVYLINGLNGGGAAFPMTQVIGLMRELGHEVTVLALMVQDGKAALRLERDHIPHEIIGYGPYDFFLPAVRLFRRLRKLRPDVLWTSLTRATIYGQLAGRALGIPVVSWQHSAYLKPGNVVILRPLAGLTSHWVADSQAVREFAHKTLYVDIGRITVWTPFVADSELPVATPRNGNERFRLGSLGRLHHSKQYAVLLKALARAREIDGEIFEKLELHIAGDGPQNSVLRTLVRSLDLEQTVHFAGFVEEPGKFLARLHGYIQTSLKEGFCIAAHEAMQAALPVISTRVGELAYSVHPGQTGWLCDVGDVEALAHAMIDLASDPVRAARMGGKAREWLLQRYSAASFRAVGERLLDQVQAQLSMRAARSVSRSH